MVLQAGRGAATRHHAAGGGGPSKCAKALELERRGERKVAGASPACPPSSPGGGRAMAAPSLACNQPMAQEVPSPIHPYRHGAAWAT